MQHRVARRGLLERAVAVPELVGDVVDDLGVVARRHLAIHLHVGDVRELVVLEAVRLPLLQLAQAEVERAELFRVGDLLVLVELLAAEDEHRELVHAGDDLLHLRGGKRLRQVHAACFGREQRVDRLELDRHRHSFSSR